MTFSNGLIKRAARARQLAVPAPTCPACAGSGFYDTVSATGEVIPALCRQTPHCARHAERALAWATHTVLIGFTETFPH